MSPTVFFDSHTHPPVRPESGDDLFFEEAAAENVRYMVAASAQLSSARSYAEWSLRHNGAWFAAGIHPHDAEAQDSNPLPEFDVFHKHPKLAAIGEIGLDYFYGFSERKAQIKIFEYFLNLALQWELPAIIHCRDQTPDGPAYADAFAILGDFVKTGGKFVLHCFAGSVAYAERAYELGGYTGVTGMVTFKAADNIREWVKLAPIDRLLIETDSPYLAPLPFRGKPNHSKLLPLIAQKAADLREMPLERMAAVTTENAFRLFNLPTEPEKQ